MATFSSTNPDTLVTLKINVEGTNRRFKLPLRDLGASTLPDKLRSLLGVLPSSEAVFERYSDSAAAFVLLDSQNASVYKQLYRAAKAKLKLRLRVTITDKPHTIQPKPATVEDEALVQNEQLESLRYLSPPASPPKETPQIDGRSSPESALGELERRVEAIFQSRAINKIPNTQSTLRESDWRVHSPEVDVEVAPAQTSEIPVTRGIAAHNKWFAELAGVSNERQAAIRTSSGPPAVPNTYSVYCNSCNSAIPDEHYHCSTCDDGDYDLCQKCIDGGILCGGSGHWMIKRFVKNGKVIKSTTETIPPKPKHTDSKITLVAVEAVENKIPTASRTCNSCVQEFNEDNFVTCTSCDDFDLCIACHVGVQHGHHPKHAFAPALEGASLDPLAQALLQPGRNASHQAICDGCDKYIYGVRHKCLDCPDWDFCPDCVVNSSFVHPGHRFVPIYEPLTETNAATRHFFTQKVRHFGIYCDGPLCTRDGLSTYIQGDRYKCAVCNDYDLCASCEASPSNTHNKTHPLIKFKTPVRHVSVTTMGDHEKGPMPVMGDRRSRCTRSVSKSTSTCPAAASVNAATQVQTVADLEPVVKAEELDTIVPSKDVSFDSEKVEDKSIGEAARLDAQFVRDTVQDGSIINPSTVFEQTWTLRNNSSRTWPAGCTVKFVGGDNMCAVDPEHPASVHELVSASESTTCYTEVAPGQVFDFTVLMRTPSRSGKVISYWRLTSPTGEKFGHRLWCDVTVAEPAPAKEIVEEEVVKESVPEIEHSQMVFPKLEKESPASSVHQATPVAESEPVESEHEDDFDNDFDDDETEDGFMTDEEWDVLDASDEEYLAEQTKVAKK